MAEQGSRAGRETRHKAAERVRKDRKRLRQRRSKAHDAMRQAEQIRRRRKKGASEFDKIMAELGYEAKEKFIASGSYLARGREITGTDVLDKYEERS